MKQEPRVLVRNAGDPEQVAAATRRERRDVDERVSIVAAQLATPEGRRFVWDIVLAGWRDYVTAPGSVEQLAFEAGQRVQAASFGREVFEQHGRAFLEMEREAIERHERRQAELLAAHARRTKPDHDSESADAT